MTRDYKPAPRKQKTAGKGSVFFSGFLLGLIVGVGASVAVAIFVKGGESPFATPERAPRIETPPQNSEDGGKNDAAGNAAPDDASRFDFYKILPSNESQVTAQEIQRKEEQAPAKVVNDRYYLQVGAFQTEQEADNLKAQLALLGLEAIVQTAEVADKGVWHRVRVGPYGKLEQLNRVRATLSQNGFNAELVKVQSNQPDQ